MGSERRRLRVWGGTDFLSSEEVAAMRLPPTAHNQYRCIVAARTKKRAVELLDCSMHHFNDYWSETGNAIELAVAVEEDVWYAPMQGRMADDYKRLPGRAR